MHLELFFVSVLIPYAPIVGVLRFFSPGAPAGFVREEYAGYVTSCRVLVMVSEGAGVLFSDGGTGAVLPSWWGPLGLCEL
jgi:hypothetical protein